ncbi:MULTISPECIES: STAS domain-containing protein [unclassified Streptomyces]|uniref:STAS domain-containing protein n=1 Tax=unclassified Streptomyces TaxID=2593676 RepID=UPI002E362ED2|nr:MULTISPECIES: STAS domain-containing protein [unclassified Streptomyces]
MDHDFRVMMRRYGSTVHLTLAGELDLEGRSVLDEVQVGLDGAAVVACDMQHLTFLDVVGLRDLTAFVRRFDGRGIAFFAYNWQPQPRRLLDLVDGLYPTAGNRAPARLLRRSLRDATAPLDARQPPGPESREVPYRKRPVLDDRAEARHRAP